MAKSNSKDMVPEAHSVGSQTVKDIFSLRTFYFLRNYR